jgi:cysteine synthase
MARIAADVTWLIGRTPLVELRQLSPAGVRILAKIEATNPTGSNKDRAALGMILDAERNAFLQPGGTLVECSGGDLGISIAMVGRRRGYRVVLTMPEWLAQNRANILATLGAEVVMTPAVDGMAGAMQRAEQIARVTPGAVCLQAFSNRANTRIHAETTAREIWEDTDGTVHVVVVPVGTGGTAAGCCAFFKELGVKVVAVEPEQSRVLTGHPAGSHGIPGIGAGFVPEVLVPHDLAEIVPVSDEQAITALRRLARSEAILAGPASGAVMHAAVMLAERPMNNGKTIVAVLPDSAERFLEHAAYQGSM